MTRPQLRTSATPFILWSSALTVVAALIWMSFDVWMVGSATLSSGYAWVGALLWQGMMLVVAAIQAVGYRLNVPSRPFEKWSVMAPVLAAVVLVAAGSLLLRIGIAS